MVPLIGLAVASVFPAPATQAEVPREVILLARMRRNVQAWEDRLPDYTCLETIERAERPSAARPFKRIDTVRLEVGQVGKKEVFGWPGAEDFQARDAIDLVAAGTISTGEFAGLLHAVFLAGTGRITWHGEEDLNGRRALRYDFSLPLFAHRWRVNLAGRRGDVGEEGSFWADPDSLDVLRVESRAMDIPPDLPLAEMVSRIDYGRMRIHSADVWLPQSAEVLMVEMSGRQSLNRIEFSHCRQFTGSSTISFDAPAPGSLVPQPRAVAPFEVPAGLLLPMRLETEIDSRKASVGDLITARIESDVVRKSDVVIPQGAQVRGRVRRLEKSADGGANFVVGLEFSDLEFGDRRARFFGRLESIQEIAGVKPVLTASRTKSVRVGGAGDMPGFTVQTTQTESFISQPLPGVGTFFVSGEQFRLPAGLKMTWRTVQP